MAVLGHRCKGGCLSRSQVHGEEGLQSTPTGRNGDSVSDRVGKRFGDCDRDVANVQNSQVA